MPSVLLSSDYAYALEDYNTMLGCPQCRARAMTVALGDAMTECARAWRIVCWEVLTHDHECGKT